jgi:hypothetical protein
MDLIAQTGTAELTNPETTVCVISRHPERYNQNRVRIVAQIESDGFEHTDLVDRACNEFGIVLDYSSKFRGKDNLVTAIASPLPGTVDKEISGIFIGRFEWHPKERDKQILILEKVDKLKVVHK